MVTMHFTRARDLLVAGLVGFGLTFPLFRFAFGELPSLPTLAGVTLLVLACVELALAFVIRSRIRSHQVVTGLWIARAVALAKASSLLGSLMAGAWLGALSYLAPRSSEIVAASEDLPAAIVGVCCAAALIGAALWLEHCCRTPGNGDRDDRNRGPAAD
ncbi:membrane protein [Saccharomonospora viridis]|nr:membrane protein [Saccharomonospora viridis]